MSGLVQYSESHANLESFDPAVFVADDCVPEPVCSFVLALAVVYNDLKDITYGMQLLDESKPKSPAEVSRVWGTHGGIETHLYRGYFGVVHELFNLLSANDGALGDPFLGSVIRTMPRRAQEAWETLTQVAGGLSPKTKLGKALLLVRNKVAFHYDAGQIHRGYQDRFAKNAESAERAYLSRGDAMRTSRFFFADAAVAGYMHNAGSAGQWEEFIGEAIEVFMPINRALMGIVVGFIQKRAGSFRTERDRGSV